MALRADSLLLENPGPLARTEPAELSAVGPAPVGQAPAKHHERDLAIDLLRGLAMLILVVNHIHLESALEYATTTVLSAAEVLVAVSGVVAGMVFGRRWISCGPRATTRMLLARARTLYLATVGVITVIGALIWAPGIATDVVTASPNMAAGTNLYAFDGPLRTAVAVVTLEAGPWQFNILGLFIVLLLVSPAIRWAFARGWWPWVLVGSWLLFAIGRTWPSDVLPAQSERPFPILVWQALFVHGMALGYHRQAITRSIGAWHRAIAAGILGPALIALSIRLSDGGNRPDGARRAARLRAP